MICAVKKMQDEGIERAGGGVGEWLSDKHVQGSEVEMIGM